MPNLRTSGNIRDSLPFLGNGRPSAVRTEYTGFTGTSVVYPEYRVLRGKPVAAAQAAAGGNQFACQSSTGSTGSNFTR